MRRSAPILAALTLLLATRWLLAAWTADDAYITYRCLDNLLHGHGLRWNSDERVQAFTHPLWALLHVPLAALGASLPVASALLSGASLAALLWVLWRHLALDAERFALAVAVPLFASQAFTDYASSGLESPATALLLVAFAALALRRPTPWLAVSLAAALAALNRLDSLVLTGPCCLALALRRPRQVAWGRVALGALPLVLWELFSLFYFGFLLPNTKYAKLDTGVPALALTRQGVAYLWDLLARDPTSALLLIAGLAAAGRAGLRAARAARGRAHPPAAPAPAGGARPGDALLAALGAGLLLHALYVVAIGGDFMRGRLFAAPLALAVLLLGRAARELPLRRLAAGAALLLLASGATAVRHHGMSPDATSWRGIADERAVFSPYTALLAFRREHDPSDHPWARAGLRARREGRPAIRRGAVGLLGFHAGPGVVVIDTFGLGDPLLARLPASDPYRWRIGHFWREPPAGYEHARASGDASFMDPDLRRYWEKLRLVIAGPLFSRERLLEILRFQAGRYDGWRDAYLERRG
jgi:arabinofuranosyltransferase